MPTIPTGSTNILESDALGSRGGGVEGVDIAANAKSPNPKAPADLKAPKK